ncbi:terminase small subunit (plasmid) [Microbulbifer sp. CnH-101-G]|uniref:terminase small subunit n=1 Tax=Microbulbifer sp. CnH-101-G TaxID=3243393 RepID=UPI004039F802
MAETKQKPRKKQIQTAASTAGKKAGNDQPAPVPDYWLNKRQVCDSLGITATAFDKWKVEPVSRQGNKNYYTVRSLLDNREEALVRKMQLERPAQVAGDLDPMQEQARLSKERADQLALKNELARGETIPAESAALIFGKVGSEMASIFDSLEANIKRQVPSLTATELGYIKAERVKLQNLAASVPDRLEEFIDELIGGADTGD